MGERDRKTERERAEEALKESEERFRSLADASFEGIAICDEDGKVLEANRAFVDMFGYGLAEARGMDVLEFYVPEDRDRARQKIPARPDETYEAVGYRKDGTTFELEVRGRVASRGGGTIRISALRDVTNRKRAEEALRESEERYRAVVEQAAEGIVLVDADDRRLIEANPEFRQTFGYTAEEIPGLSLYKLVAHDPASVDRNIELVLREGSRTVGERRFRRKDGMLVNVMTSGSAVKYGGRRVVCIVIRDITERKQAEEALRESEERFRTLVQNASDMMSILNPDGTIRYVSPAVERVLGYRPEERVGIDAFGEDTHPHDAERMRGVFAEGLRNPGGVSKPLEFRVRHKDGSWRTLEAMATNHLDHPAIRGIVVNARDVTERKAYEELLEHQALHDPLTGLPTRTLFVDRLRHALVRKKRRQGGGEVAVLFLDLDNFKVVNDSLGHEAGDRLLVAATRRLSGLLRPGDTIARFGGDEFAVLLEIAASGEAVRVAERIEEALRDPFDLRGHETFVTASVGIAFGSGAEGGSDELLRAADLAMYRAKKSGKARYEVFEPRMGSEALERLKLEGELRRAVEREELALCYQPKASLESGRIVGMEALVRWEHPERGLLLPEKFVPLAEETGLIVPLGKWVLKEACRQAGEWRERTSEGANPVMCVNVSARQFGHPSLARDVAEALREADLGPGALDLEITESTLVDTPRTASTLDELKRLGVNLVVDDFGTGYSSLSYLKRLPVDFVKIDKSFVAGLGEGREEEQIAAAVISMSHTLGLRTVAEGVETEGQLKLLRELGCDLAQGHLFSGPMPPEAVPELLAAGPRWS